MCESPKIKFWRDLINDHLERRVPVQYTIGDPLLHVREELESQYPFEDGKEWNKFDRSPYDHFLAVLRMVLEELESKSPDEYKIGVLLDHLLKTLYGFERGDQGTDLVAEYLTGHYQKLSPPTKKVVVKALFSLGRPNTIGFWLQVGHDLTYPQPEMALTGIVELCGFNEILIPVLTHMADLSQTGRHRRWRGPILRVRLWAHIRNKLRD